MKLTEMFAHWGQVRSDLLSSMDQFSQEELSYTPFKGSWPVGQILLHIADCEDNWLHGVVQGNFKPWIFYNISDYPTKAAIAEVLDHAHTKTIEFLSELEEKDLKVEYKTPHGETFPLYWILWHVLEHEIHHRGELSLIHGLLGREGWGA